MKGKSPVTEEVGPDLAGPWSLGGMTLARGVEFVGLGRSKLLEAVYGGQVRHAKIGRRLLLDKTSLIDLLKDSEAGK